MKKAKVEDLTAEEWVILRLMRVISTDYRLMDDPDFLKACEYMRWSDSPVTMQALDLLREERAFVLKPQPFVFLVSPPGDPTDTDVFVAVGGTPSEAEYFLRRKLRLDVDVRHVPSLSSCVAGVVLYPGESEFGRVDRAALRYKTPSGAKSPSDVIGAEAAAEFEAYRGIALLGDAGSSELLS